MSTRDPRDLLLRADLIGSWRQRGGSSVIHLRADGQVVCEGHPKSGGIIRESGVWQHVHEKFLQFHLRLDPPPGALSRPAADLETVEYEIVSFAPGRMTLTQPEFEFPIIYERVISPDAREG